MKQQQSMNSFYLLFLILLLILVGGDGGEGSINSEATTFTSGPKQTRVYMGGNIPSISSIVLNNIGYYNYEEQTWHTLGGGTNGPVKVVKLDSFGNVYIGGNFTRVGGFDTGPFAAYNIYTDQWYSFGLNSSQFSIGSVVNAIVLQCSYNNPNLNNFEPCNIHVGGKFSVSLIGGQSASNLITYEIKHSKWIPFNIMAPTDSRPNEILHSAYIQGELISMAITKQSENYSRFEISYFGAMITFISTVENLWEIYDIFASYCEIYSKNGISIAIGNSEDSHVDISITNPDPNRDLTMLSKPFGKKTRVRAMDGKMFIAGDSKGEYPSSVIIGNFQNSSSSWIFSSLGINYPQETILSMDILNDIKPGSLFVGGENFVKFYDSINNKWFEIVGPQHLNSPITILDIAIDIDSNSCPYGTFGISCENKFQHVENVIEIPPNVLDFQPVEINDGLTYIYEWKFREFVKFFNTTSTCLHIENPFAECGGCTSISAFLTIYDSNGKIASTLYNFNTKFPLYQTLRTQISYDNNLSFKISNPLNSVLDDGSDVCKIGVIEENVKSLKELVQNTNYKIYDIPCNSTSIIQVPYYGNPYTKMKLMYENLKYSNYSTLYKQEEIVIPYFPTFFANLANGTGNGTQIHVTTENEIISFYSTIHSNIPFLKCKADLVIGNVTITIFESNCTTLFNFTYFLPYQKVAEAELIITLSNAKYFFEEVEHFDIELVTCSLPCENGGKCKKNGSSEYCECNEGFVGEYCQSCNEGFTLQFGKCACPSGFQQVGNGCVKGDSGDTSCFGKNRTDSSVCSGQGNCTSFNLCKCNQGFSGQDCSLPICFGQVLNACNGNGQCTAPDVCKCNDLFGGLTCEIAKCNGLVESEGGCSFHGSCNPNTHLCECSGNFMGSKCSLCKDGFTGAKCNIPICYGISAIDSSSVCNGNGECSGHNQCQCHSNYSGSSCADFKCNGIEKNSPLVCSSNGYCTGPDVCTCQNSNFDSTSFCSKCLPSFTGSNCSTIICNPETTCKGHGQCNEQLECVCNGNFTGSYCEKCQDEWFGDDCEIQCSSQLTCSGKGTCSSNGTCICSNSHGEHCEICNDGWYGESCDFNMDLNSFEFNENGDTITAKVVSVFKKNIDCSSLIVNIQVLGENPSCSLDGDNNLFTIKLGALSTIVIGGNLNVKNYIDSSSASIVKVKGTYYNVNPVAYLTSDKSVIGCGSITLDASSSSSLDGKLIFTFSVRLAPNSDALSILNSLISGTSSSVKFNVDDLPNGIYTVQVTVQSSFSGRVSYASYSFTVTNISPPNLSIKNGPSSSVTIGSSFIVTPIVSFPSCYGGNPSISSLKFTYTQLSGPIVQIKQQNELLVFNSDYTNLVEEGKYVFSLKAQQDGYPAATTTFEIMANKLPLKVSFNIRDMSLSMEDDIKFKVIKQDPSSPTVDDTNGLVTLLCVNLETLQDCPGFKSGTNIDQSTLTFNKKFNPGSYLFTAVYSKNERSSSSKVKVIVTNQSKLSFLRVYISTTPIDADLSSINPSKDLILQSHSLDILTLQRMYSWSSRHLNLTNIDTTKKYLTIPKNQLVAGAFYSISVKIMDGDRVGEAVISFQVHTPPMLGILNINPSNGIALSDEFTISCNNVNSQLQSLTYQFLYKQKGELYWKVLKERSETKSFSTQLPSGELEIKAIVYDSFESFSESSVKIIQVRNPITISQAIQSLNSMSLSLSITSSSASSALSVFKSLSTILQTSEEKQQLINSTSKITLEYFNQVDKEESLTSQTVTSTSSSISVISSVSNCVENLPESTINIVIDKFKSTVEGASSKLVLSDEDIESSLSSATIIQSYIVKNKVKRSISLFTQDQVNILDHIKETLMNIKLKNLVADMSAIRTFGYDSYSYVRLLSISSLSNLNDNINGISSITLSPTFNTLQQFNNLESVKLEMKVQSMTSSLTKLFTFKLVSSIDNSEIVISSIDSIAAKLTIEFNDGVEEDFDGLYICHVMKNGKMEKSDSCKVISGTYNNTKTIEVSSTGSFAIIQVKDIVDIPTQLTKLEYLALLTLIVPVIAVIFIVIAIIIGICVVRKIREKVQTTPENKT